MNPFQIQIFIFIAIIIFFGANSFRQNGNIIPLKPGSSEKKYLKQKPFLHANEWYQDPFHENLTIEEFTDDIDCVHEDPYYSNPSPYSYYEQKCVQEQNKKQCEINNINILSYFYQKQIFSNIHVPNNTPVWCIFLLPPEKKSQCNSAKTNIEPSYLPLYLKFNSESIDLDKSGASDVEFIFSKNQITANIIKIENKTFFEISKIIQNLIQDPGNKNIDEIFKSSVNIYDAYNFKVEKNLLSVKGIKMLCYIIGHENVFIMRVLNSNFLLIKRNLNKLLQFADQWSYSKNLPYTYFSHSHIAQFKYHINNLNVEWYLHIESVYGHLKKSYNYGVLKKRMMILCICRDNNAREFAFVDFFSVKIAEEEDNDDLKSDVLHDKV